MDPADNETTAQLHKNHILSADTPPSLDLQNTYGQNTADKIGVLGIANYETLGLRHVQAL